jgi:hypothetical protein
MAENVPESDRLRVIGKKELLDAGGMTDAEAEGLE